MRFRRTTSLSRWMTIALVSMYKTGGIKKGIPLPTPGSGGRSSSTAEWLREARVVCDTKDSGDRGRSPSQCAIRDLEGRAFLRAMWLREAKVNCDVRHPGDRGPAFASRSRGTLVALPPSRPVTPGTAVIPDHRATPQINRLRLASVLYRIIKRQNRILILSGGLTYRPS
jgi:hypothetical protein